LVACAAAAAGCAEPSGSVGDFHAKVVQSAKQAQSAVASSQLIAQADLDGKTTEAYADTVATDAENDVDSVQTALDTRQPADTKSIKLRDQFDTILQDAVTATEDLRIAIRRDDPRSIRTGIDEAAKALKKLQAYSQ
jgi:hypothetical protein